LREIARLAKSEPRLLADADVVCSEAATCIRDASSDVATVTLCLATLADLIGLAGLDPRGDEQLLANALAAAERTGWWEARCWCIEIACEMLCRADRQDGIVKLVSFVVDVAAASQTPATLVGTARSLSRALGTCGDPKICPGLVCILLSLPAQMVRSILSGSASQASLFPDSARQLSFLGQAEFSSPVSLAQLWTGSTDAIAKEVAAQVKKLASDPPTAALEVLRACVQPALEQDAGARRIKQECVGVWAEVLTALKDSLYVELCKPLGCLLALELLEPFFASIPKAALETMPLLLAAVTLLAGADADARCRRPVADFLRRTAACSEVHHTAITNLLLHLPQSLPYTPDFKLT
jgi:hypothetical protein